MCPRSRAKDARGTAFREALAGQVVLLFNRGSGVGTSCRPLGGTERYRGLVTESVSVASAARSPSPTVGGTQSSGRQTQARGGSSWGGDTTPRALPGLGALTHRSRGRAGRRASLRGLKVKGTTLPGDPLLWGRRSAAASEPSNDIPSQPCTVGGRKAPRLQSNSGFGRNARLPNPARKNGWGEGDSKFKVALENQILASLRRNSLHRGRNERTKLVVTLPLTKPEAH